MYYPRFRTLGILSVLFCGICGCNDSPNRTDVTKTEKDASKKDSEKESGKPSMPQTLSIQSEPYPAGEDKKFDHEITQYMLSNKNGLQVTLINYGAIITAVNVPDKNGRIANITMGFDSLDGYLKGHPYFGSTIGRYGNRIAGGKFTLNGQEYTLEKNNGENHLHGGEKGFDKRVWQATEIKDEDSVGIKFTYSSPDGEEGYPGELRVSVTYSLTNDNDLKMEYEAMAMGDTVLNLTNHCYWNLSTPSKGAVHEHQLKLNCDKYLPVNDSLIPTGELKPVASTPMDFTEFKAIGSRLKEVKGDDPQGGYDHCYVINRGKAKPDELVLAAEVKDPESGRVMTIRTDQPGIQFYTGNFLSEEEPGQLGQHRAFCLETQHFPDSPNQKDFPSTALQAGQVFRSTTIHHFSVEK